MCVFQCVAAMKEISADTKEIYKMKLSGNIYKTDIFEL